MTRPQFYAEDGSVWYEDAYNLGAIRSLSLPNGGYLNTLPRLAAWLSLLAPFHFAPLILNLCGIAIQLLPAAYLLSDRLARLAPFSIRLGMAGLYLLLPNSREVHVVVTNAHFHRAVLAFLIIVSPKPAGIFAKIFDGAVVCLAAVSGPFSLVLLPVAVLYWTKKKCGWTST